ncbi:MAG: hypothetical protein IJZ53_07430 [Tyzzerella sp.]|nr:hypothetical protein [Tyzzerella sp.]
MKEIVYVGIGPEKGNVIEAEQAYQYALERCLHGTTEDQQEFKKMLVDWFYSGNFIKEEISNE